MRRRTALWVARAIFRWNSRSNLTCCSNFSGLEGFCAMLRMLSRDCLILPTSSFCAIRAAYPAISPSIIFRAWSNSNGLSSSSRFLKPWSRTEALTTFLTKFPFPPLVSTNPKIPNATMASLTEGRETPNLLAKIFSGGSLSPGFSFPFFMSSSICLTTRIYTFSVFTSSLNICIWAKLAGRLSIHYLL